MTGKKWRALATALADIKDPIENLKKNIVKIFIDCYTPIIVDQRVKYFWKF